MKHAYIQERIWRTIHILTTNLGSLRERLPVAYDEGFGTIATSEFGVFSEDISFQFRQLKDAMNSVVDPTIGNARASVLQMNEETLISTAEAILEIASAVEGKSQEKEPTT